MTIHSIKVMNWPGRAVTFFEGLFHMYLKTYEPEVQHNMKTNFKIAKKIIQLVRIYNVLRNDGFLLFFHRLLRITQEQLDIFKI